jgi:hypothetical protein
MYDRFGQSREASEPLLLRIYIAEVVFEKKLICSAVDCGQY